MFPIGMEPDSVFIRCVENGWLVEAQRRGDNRPASWVFRSAEDLGKFIAAWAVAPNTYPVDATPKS